MSVQFDIEIKSVEESLRNLRSLDRKLRRRAVTRAVNQSAKPMVQRVRVKSLPRRTGALWKSIRRTSTRIDWQRGTVTAKISSKSTKGQRKKGFDAFYAHMVAGGTKRHQITLKSHEGRGRRRKRIGTPKKLLSDRTQKFGTVVNHPGYQGRDFYNQAFRSGARETTRTFGRRFGYEVEAEVAKLNVQ